MSLAKASLWTATNTPVKIGAGLLIGKLLIVLSGLARSGLVVNFRQLITVLGMLARAGIFNGVTKYVAQYHDNSQQLYRMVGTSSAMIFGFSTLMALVFVLAATPISRELFGNTDYQGLVRLIALVQMGIAWGNLLLTLMKGFRDAAGNALSLIVSSLIGVLVYCISHRLGGYEGASLGPALIPALVVIPIVIISVKRDVIPLSYLKPSWDNGLAGQLSKFTFMALATSVTLPVAYIMARKLLAVQYNWGEVGIWQGVSSIFDTYLQSITAPFSIHLLPTLSQLAEKHDIAREMVKLLRFVLPAVAAMSLTVWLLRDSVIWLLLSNKSAAMRDLFARQLVGDVLKVGAYTSGYLVTVEASLRFYILVEISQFTSLMVFAHWLIPAYGTLGAAQAYVAIYIVCFSLCYGVFLLQRRWA